MATAWIALLGLLCLPGTHQDYLPNWQSLDSRPLPVWYDQAKIGIFMHWGVFSVPSYGSEWFWWNWKGAKYLGYQIFMEQNYRPGFTYADFAPMFKAEFYDPIQWAKILKSSGARYVVLTSKHHEGFTNWPSKVSWNWNSMDTGPHRDLVGELAAAIRSETDMHFGLYHSLFEWFHPLYLQDKANNYTTQMFVKTKTMPELHEIINAYKPELLWSDGDWMVTDTYWNATQFLAWLYNESPVKDTIVVNDRWGKNIRCHHGGYFNCDDKFNPGVLQKHKWENAMTLDKYSWGFRRNAHLADYLTMDDLTDILAETISCGGNLLVNIGPTAHGTIVPIFEERLGQLGQWLGVNGEAIYSSFPWTFQNDTLTPRVWYTAADVQMKRMVYAIVLDWPQNSTLSLGAVSPTPTTQVTLLGYSGTFSWKKGPGDGITIVIPPIPANRMPCKWAWVFRFEGLEV
ncbi:alpha-L-fucosidase-like [Liolophura sinensis]|uniref:alpha-L-fucosidase-like n=1 Tax=Liolophura sinensis TaxID=3198878 RepID=UPI0031592B14